MSLSSPRQCNVLYILGKVYDDSITSQTTAHTFLNKKLAS